LAKKNAAPAEARERRFWMRIYLATVVVAAFIALGAAVIIAALIICATAIIIAVLFHSIVDDFNFFDSVFLSGRFAGLCW
jgi:hypothetical protein